MFLDFFFWNADLYSLKELPIKARRREEKTRREEERRGQVDPNEEEGVSEVMRASQENEGIFCPTIESNNAAKLEFSERAHKQSYILLLKRTFR